MANEKRTSLTFSVVEQGLTTSLTLSLLEDLTGSKSLGTPQDIGTAWEALTLSDLGSADLIAVKNNDATNYVQLATANDNSGIFARLTPGRGAFFPPETSATLYARANTAECELAKLVVEP